MRCFIVPYSLANIDAKQPCIVHIKRQAQAPALNNFALSRSFKRFNVIKRENRNKMDSISLWPELYTSCYLVACSCKGDSGCNIS